MPRPFPAEFRLRAVALVRAGKTITATAAELSISTGALHNWVRQDQIEIRRTARTHHLRVGGAGEGEEADLPARG